MNVVELKKEFNVVWEEFGVLMGKLEEFGKKYDVDVGSYVNSISEGGQDLIGEMCSKFDIDDWWE